MLLLSMSRRYFSSNGDFLIKMIRRRCHQFIDGLRGAGYTGTHGLSVNTALMTRTRVRAITR